MFQVIGESIRKMKKALYLCFLSYFYCQDIPIPAYTLTPSQRISDGQTLYSQEGKFELGFFSPSSSSNNRYLGIWYKTIPVQTVVWVANRASPIPDTSGVVRLDQTGNIVIVDGAESIIWSSNSTKAVENPIVELLDSGNLVLRDSKNGDSKSYIWQSFDYPTDTMLPGMKIGWNFKTGLNRILSSWRSFDNPSRGDFSYGIELAGFPELIMRKRSQKYYRAGPWNGVPSTGIPDLSPDFLITYEVIVNEEEHFFWYQVGNPSVIMRSVLVQTDSEGRIDRFIWDDESNSWNSLMSLPVGTCDEYALCGSYSTCDTMNAAICKCFKGFKPKSPKDWNLTDWSKGCQREVPLNCSNENGFQKYTGVKLPETASSWYNMNMSLEECRVMCLSNCSCLAYANAYITGGGSGCVIWFTELIDIKLLSKNGNDLYVRMPASESANRKMKKNLTTIVSITSAVGILVFGFGCWYFWIKSGSKGCNEKDDLELPQYSLATITVATNNFSEENRLGGGGFGPVYKGKLEDGQEIAVKKLSKDSTQGVDEFKNEVLLISKLQHRNLVKLLGCCIQKEEKMLVYEYMSKNSLDTSIFDEENRRLLSWQKRFQIIQGIAGGLHYLHHYSRLRIIHRDLKASNVLLDSEMVPKISDFGMARIFRGDQVEEITKRVVGTYGYMSPEYMMHGNFSEKSDVYSFGVLILEIISGKKNWGFHHGDYELNLLGHAWKLWNEDRASEFVDPLMSNSSVDLDILRCIHIGLLCVQGTAKQRPTMSSVMIMLGSETEVLLSPQSPGFYLERGHISHSLSGDRDTHGSNVCSITVIEGR